MLKGKQKYRVLTNTHTHNGQPVQKGDIIELRAASAEKLKDVVELVTGQAAKADAKDAK